VHPIWLSDLLRAENDQVAGLLKQPDKQKLASLLRQAPTTCGRRVKGQTRVLKNLKCVEKAWFPVS